MAQRDGLVPRSGGREVSKPEEPGLSSRAGEAVADRLLALRRSSQRQLGDHGGVQSYQASQLECGSAQAGWFASSIQRKWNLGGDSIIKPADSGSIDMNK
uniref:Uncharacterized protein n=1 Tax=Sphaerodactylus townsendi TaxID=933632 RepID=A0ACB8FPK2_9SAUR